MIENIFKCMHKKKGDVILLSEFKRHVKSCPKCKVISYSLDDLIQKNNTQALAQFLSYCLIKVTKNEQGFFTLQI